VDTVEKSEDPWEDVWLEQGFEAKKKLALEMIIAFIVCHELAHIMEGHLSRDRISRQLSMMSGRQTEVVVNDIDRENEHDADFVALSCVLQAYGHIRVLAEVALFFNLLAAVDKIGFRPIFWGHSHPSPVDRLQYLANISCPDELRGSWEDALNSYRQFGTTLPKTVIDRPDHFRQEARSHLPTPDTQADVDSYQRVLEAARLTNLARTLIGADSLQAIGYLRTARELLRQSSYGAGARISCSSLADAYLDCGSIGAACKTLVEGIEEATSTTIVRRRLGYAGHF
jgi:Peptidase family M48